MRLPLGPLARRLSVLFVGVAASALLMVVACDSEATPTAGTAATSTPSPVATPVTTATNVAPATPGSTQTSIPTLVPTPVAAPTVTPTPTAAPLPTPRLTKAPTPTPEAETTLSPAEEAAIEALPWVSNGLTNNEQQIVVRLRELASWAEPVFQELVSKPWVSGTQDNPQWELVVRYLFHMAAEDEAAALRTLELKFLDTYELGDSATTLFLRDLLQSDPDALWELLSHPRLSPEAREDQPDSLAFLYLQSRNPEAAALMESLPWVEDGLEGGEQHSVLHLQELALTSERVFQAFLAEEREWLPLDPWIDVRVVQLLVSISELDESSALEILDLPLLQSVGIAEYEALHRLRDFLRLDPALFHEALAHPALSRANYDDVGVVVSLLYLEHIDPEAAEALEGLAWVQDGVGRPAREDVFSANADPTEFEERILFGLIELATRSHELSMAMVNEPWMQDGMGFWEYMSLYPLMDLAGRDPIQTQRILEMPFLETLEGEDVWILQKIQDSLWEEPGDLGEFLSHPVLAGGIQDRGVTVALVRLNSLDPEAARAIGELPWVQDGLAPGEERAVDRLIAMAKDSKRVFEAAIGKPWVRDGMNEDEISVGLSLRAMSDKSYDRREESGALALLEMPFLESVDAVDAAAVETLHRLQWKGDGSALQQVLSHPAIADGITDDEAIAVAVSEVVRADTADFHGLLDPEQATIQTRVFSTTLSPEIKLAVIRLDSGAEQALDLLEQVVRAHEAFMGVPFPHRFVAMVMGDPGGYRSVTGGSGILAIHPVQLREHGFMPHQLTNPYWTYGPQWLRQGAGYLLGSVSQKQLPQAREEDYRAKCDLAENLGQLDQLSSEKVRDDELYSCLPSMGLGLFTDLYLSLVLNQIRIGRDRGDGVCVWRLGQ